MATERPIQQIAHDLLHKKLESLGNIRLVNETDVALTSNNTAADFLCDYLEREEIIAVLRELIRDALASAPADAKMADIPEVVRLQDMRERVAQLAFGRFKDAGEQARTEADLNDLKQDRVLPSVIPLLEKLAQGEKISPREEIKLAKAIKRLRVIQEDMDKTEVVDKDAGLRAIHHDMAHHFKHKKPGEPVEEALARGAGGKMSPDSEEILNLTSGMDRMRHKHEAALVKAVLADLKAISLGTMRGESAGRGGIE